MAGHSKWANIQHRKGPQDKKRSKEFAKLAKDITVAAMGGIPNPDSNPALRLAILKAKSKSMPKKNIETAVAKAVGNKDGVNYSELVYTANVAGVSFLINCLTDNNNRTSSEVQHLISKAGGAVAGASSVNYIFDRKGVLILEKKDYDADEIMMQALEVGASDFEAEGELLFIYTEPTYFTKVKDNLANLGFEEFKTAEVKYLPNQEVKLPLEKAEKILNLIDKLEDYDDIQDVYHNLDAASFE